MFRILVNLDFDKNPKIYWKSLEDGFYGTKFFLLRFFVYLLYFIYKCVYDFLTAMNKTGLFLNK